MKAHPVLFVLAYLVGSVAFALAIGAWLRSCRKAGEEFNRRRYNESEVERAKARAS